MVLILFLKHLRFFIVEEHKLNLKIMKIYFLFVSVFLLILTSSCKKDNVDEPPSDLTSQTELSINDIVAPFSFDWSVAEAGVLNVTVQPMSGENISTEGQTLLLIDNKDNILSKTKIVNSKATFPIKLPNNIGDVYLMYPNSANKQKLNNVKDDVVMTIAPQPRNNSRNGLVYDKKFAFKYQRALRNSLSNKSVNGDNLVQNGEFDIDNLEKDSRNWTELRESGKWYFTYGTDIHITNVDGENVFKTTSNREIIEQSFPVQGGAEYDFSMIYTGTIILYLDNFDATGKWIGETHVITTGNSIASSGVILENATHFQFYIAVQENSSVDKIVYESVDVVPDTDGDGVNDNGDEYPDDATKAYKINYPTVGHQILCFEDLWPSKGDYDFNDLVIDLKCEFSTNAEGKYVSATFNGKIRASGGSIPLGFACEFIDANRTSIPTSIVTSVSGTGSKDDNVNNSVIFFNDKFDIMVPYYTNTSYDYTGDYVEFTTSVTLNGEYSGVLLLNYYTYRTNERTYEVHLPNYSPTGAADLSILGTKDDNEGTPYRTSTGLPWAIEIVSSSDFNDNSDDTFKHPLEQVKITDAYLKFDTWATSAGVNDKDWYLTPVSGKVFISN